MKFKSGLINKLAAQHKQLGVNASIKIADAIDASIERLGLSADISPINKLAAAIELGDFIIHKHIDESVLVVDGSTTIDTFVMNFFKSLSDDVVGTSDSIYKFDTTKGFNHTTAISSHVATALSKPLQDEAALSDTFTLLTDKSFLDGSSVSDSDVLAVGKYLANAASLVEELRYALSRGISDGSAATDKTALITEKHLDDITVFADDAVLLSQSYVNAFYFADDYTGTSRTG